MKFGVRGKLFLISLVLDLVLLFQVGISLESTLRSRLENNIEVSLSRHAEAGRILLETAPGGSTIDQIDPLADALGRAIQERVTVIDSGGRVLGDSSLNAKQVALLESHVDRPEFKKALADEHGLARRFSHTVSTDMLYFARSFQRAGQAGVVRIAISTEDIQEAIAEQRRALMVASLLALVLAALLTALVLEFLTRTFRNLVAHTANLSKDISQKPIPVLSGDEIGGLARSFNAMAEHLESAVVELSEDRSLMDAVLKGMGEGVVALDQNKRIILINPEAKKLLGLDRLGAGDPVSEVIPVEDIREMIDASPDSSAYCRLDFDLTSATQRCLQVFGTLMPGNHGCVLVLRDVTDARKFEQMQKEFVANVSHELRTPVHLTLINAELIRDHLAATPGPVVQLAETLELNAQRMARIIERLLFISRLDADQEQMQLEEVDWAEAVKQALALVEGTEAGKSIDISNLTPPGHTVLADPALLAEAVLFNLLDNAIKYCTPGSRVVIRTRKVGRRRRLEVEDNGPGIPPEHQGLLFERFHRVHVGQSRQMGGAGLGLAIVKQLVERMGGEVGMEPILPHGALFWVVLGSPGDT